jgi:hypothetical protein
MPLAAMETLKSSTAHSFPTLLARDTYRQAAGADLMKLWIGPIFFCTRASTGGFSAGVRVQVQHRSPI